MARILPGLFLLIGLLSQASASDFPHTGIYAIQPEDRPLLDGALDDDLWQKVPTLSSFTQVIPSEGASPTARTEVQLAYDSTTIYVAVRCYHGEHYVLAASTLIPGQSILADDRVGIRLDTFNDRRNAYLFEVNANGIRRDALVGNDFVNDDWDALWDASVQTLPDGWSAELAIPIAGMSFDPDASTWGFNFSRVLPGIGEHIAWSSRATELNPAVSGYVNGIANLDPGIGLRVMPSLSLRYTDSNASGHSQGFEPALTAFYGLTPYMTAGITLNTDFSATEVDQRRINLTRFSLFFPEKRAFFLQDAGIFEFGNIQENTRPFFSRRIGLSQDGKPLDIDAGVKLTGRIADWSVGALVVRQQPGAPEADNTLLVGRVTRNILSESSIGAIITSGDPLSERNSALAGVDFSFRSSEFLGSHVVAADAWFQRSDSEGSDDDQDSFGIRIRYPNDRIDGSLEWIRVEENFHPALGFVNRQGIAGWTSSFRYRKRLEGDLTEWVGQRIRFERVDRLTGGLDSERIQLNLFELMTRGDDIFFVFYNRETDNLVEAISLGNGLAIPAARYESDRYGVILETGLQRRFSFIAQLADGDYFGGTNLRKRLAVEWRPNEHVLASVGLVENNIELPGGRRRSKEFTARLNLALNTKWSWLNLLQFDNITDTASLNSRLRYQPAPDQTYFLVLNALADQNSSGTRDVEIVLKARHLFQL